MLGWGREKLTPGEMVSMMLQLGFGELLYCQVSECVDEKILDFVQFGGLCKF